MFLLILKLIIDFFCGLLNLVGGYCFLPARRFIMPTILALGISISSHTWWLGLLSLPVMGTLCLGYKNGKWLKRGLWLALQAFVIGIGAFLVGHIAFYLYLPYVVGAFVLGATLYNIDQIIGDFIFGSWLGIIVLLVH